MQRHSLSVVILSALCASGLAAKNPAAAPPPSDGYTRKREFLLEIAFAKRELFAYACEAYARIMERARSPADRRKLHAEYAENWVPDCDRLDRSDLITPSPS